MLFDKMSDALYLASERQQSKLITMISAGVAANCHRNCYENTPLHRLSRSFSYWLAPFGYVERDRFRGLI